MDKQASSNLEIVNFPPGVVRVDSRYRTQGRWWNTNQVRWKNNVLVPIGGWVSAFTIATASDYPWRSNHSWQDNDGISYFAIGSADKAIVIKPSNSYNETDVTPSTLVTAPPTLTGFGAGPFGFGPFGASPPGAGSEIGPENYWVFDNWGEDLVAVHSYDGRLFDWSPGDAELVPTTNAPADNALVVTSDERHCFVMGGTGNPRRVKWCSREDINLWTPAADNSAGGFELDTSGKIIAATKVPQGILVLTSVDVHLIEYIGPPSYYKPRLISDSAGVAGPFAYTNTDNGVIIMDHSGFWHFDGGLQQVPCTVEYDVFSDSNLSNPVTHFMGFNEHTREIWIFYPSKSAAEPNRYAILGKNSVDGQAWWAIGELERSSFIRASFQARPFMIDGNIVYEHERGWSAAGASRNGIVWAESGVYQLGEGDVNMHVSRVYHDTVQIEASGAIDMGDEDGYDPNPVAFSLSFRTSNAPKAPVTIEDTVILDPEDGFTTVRFKARQFYMKVTQVVDESWGLGSIRLRTKAMGAR